MPFDIQNNCRISAFRVDSRTGILIPASTYLLSNDQKFLHLYFDHSTDSSNLCMGISTSTVQYILRIPDEIASPFESLEYSTIKETIKIGERTLLAISTMKEILYKCFTDSFTALNNNDATSVVSSINSCLCFLCQISDVLEYFPLSEHLLDLSDLHEVFVEEEGKFLVQLKVDSALVLIRLEIRPSLIVAVQYLKIIKFLASMIDVAANLGSLTAFHIELFDKSYLDEETCSIITQWSLEEVAKIISSGIEIPDGLTSAFFLLVLRITANDSNYTRVDYPSKQKVCYCMKNNDF